MTNQTFYVFVQEKLKEWIEREADAILAEAKEDLSKRVRERVGAFAVELVKEFDVRSGEGRIVISFKEKDSRSWERSQPSTNQDTEINQSEK